MKYNYNGRTEVAEQQQQPVKKPMTQPERNALVKVIRSRFQVFGKHAKRTRDELKVAIFERIMADNKAKIEAAERDMAKIEERAKKLQADALATIAKHRERGVIVGSAQLVDVTEFYGTKDQRNTKAVQVSTFEGGGMTFSVTKSFITPGVDEQVEAEYAKLEREFGLGELAMAQREQELIEEVILGGVTSEEAQDFLGRVPTLDKLPEPKRAVAELSA